MQQKFAVIFIILFTISYIPIDGAAGFGSSKLLLMLLAAMGAFSYAFHISKAFVLGVLYLAWQFLMASFHPETFRWSTLLFSAGLVFSFVCIYNLVVHKKVFNIDMYIRLVNWMMLLFFVVCLLQQACLLVGITYLPAINLWKILDRGLGCNSLTIEPSTFARTMLVLYYVYVKCSEYKYGRGSYSLKELFSGEHKWVSIRFCWMMVTMGSGTAFICLILFALYFVTKKNWFYIVPSMLAVYVFVLPLFGAEHLDRATSVASAMSTMDVNQVKGADDSGALRISPLLNSLNADFTKIETWFGHGIDYARSHNLVLLHKATLFDDYGFVFYLLSLLFNLTCAYRVCSIGFLFMFAGLAGGSGGNIHYTWALMLIMAGENYFYSIRKKLKLERKYTLTK
ncbi:MAG: hypothetical protein Q4F40_02555 [Akkermansia sp.]|nr:hypothetical protein [Akkermansia sp.]